MLSMLPLRLAVVLVSCSLFKKFVQSSQSHTFNQKFLTKLLCSITYKNVQNFHQNSTLVSETHIYTK